MKQRTGQERIQPETQPSFLLLKHFISRNTILNLSNQYLALLSLNYGSHLDSLQIWINLDLSQPQWGAWGADQVGSKSHWPNPLEDVGEVFGEETAGQTLLDLIVPRDGFIQTLDKYQHTLQIINYQQAKLLTGKAAIKQLLTGKAAIKQLLTGKAANRESCYQADANRQSC